jgi:hypothetical protein
MLDKKSATEVPDYLIESLARTILPSVRKYFDSEEGQREFAEWKMEKEVIRQLKRRKLRGRNNTGRADPLALPAFLHNL